MHVITLYKLCAFPVRMCIPSEDESQWNKHPHREWRCDSPEMHIFTGNGDVPYRECRWECTSSPGMGMCLTGNAHPDQEWGCNLPGMHILTGNGDVPHREWISSPRILIVYADGNFLKKFGNSFGNKFCLKKR